MSCGPSYQIIKNIRFPKHFCAHNIEYALSYTPEKGDNFVVTYPKSGTTWTQLIIKLIINEGFNDENNTTFMRNSFLEFSGEDVIKYPVIKTHLPFHSLPYNTNANYLCVFHNPKNVSVSYFYHTL